MILSRAGRHPEPGPGRCLCHHPGHGSSERGATAGSYDTRPGSAEGGSVISCFQSSEMQIRDVFKKPRLSEPQLVMRTTCDTGSQ